MSNNPDEDNTKMEVGISSDAETTEKEEQIDTVSSADLIEIKEKRDYYSNQYIDRITDFIKYTTPLSLAAVLWIGGSYNSFVGISQFFILISLVLLFISIYLAIVIFFAGIRFSSMNLATYQTINDIYHNSWDAINSKMGFNCKKFFQDTFGINSNPKDFVDNKKKFNELREALDQLNQNNSLTEARVWDFFIRIHIYSIFLGFVFYIIANIVITPPSADFLKVISLIKIQM